MQQSSWKNKISSVTLSLLLMLILSNCSKQNIQTEAEPATHGANISAQLDLFTAWKHLQAFDAIGIKHITRHSGSVGARASIEYIEQQLKGYGLKVIKQDFINQLKAPSSNILVEIAGKSDQVLMFGAHFDSVKHGPGINDNATGVSALLATIQALQKSQAIPSKTLRFAFWDSEETGLAGSKYYVSNLSKKEKQRIDAYINFDMLGTPDPEVLVFDGDKSSLAQITNALKQVGSSDEDIKATVKSFDLVVTENSSEIKQHFIQFFRENNLTAKADITALHSCDIEPFATFTAVGGIAVIQATQQGDELEFAPCYHKACDNLSTVSRPVFDKATKSIAYLVDKMVF